MALVGWYKFDQNLNDSSGNNRTLSNEGGTILTNQGKIERCATLDGVDDRLYNGSFVLGNNNPFTMAIWIKTSQIPSSNVGIMSFGFYPVTILGTDGKVRTWWYSGSSYPTVVSSVALNDNKWHHIATTYDSSIAKLYVDGVLVDSISSPTLWSADAGFEIGVEKNNGLKRFQGDLDDARFYDHALEPQEIKNISQAKVAHYKLSDKIEQATQNLFYNKLKPTENTKVSRFGKLDGWELTGIANDQPREYLQTSSIALEPSTFYTVSAIYYSSSGVVDDFYFQFTDSGWPEGNVYLQPFVNSQASQVNGWSIIKNLGNNWFYLTGTFQTFPTTTAISTVFWDSDTAGLNIFISNLQLEKGKVASPITKNIRQGPIVKDSTYNQNHGSVTLATTPTWSNDTAVGYGSMEFNGTTNFIKIPKYKQGNDATISMWVKGTVTTGNYILLGSYNSIAVGFWDRRIIGVTTGIGSSPTGDLGTKFINGEWNHIVVKRESNGNMKYFCNGILLSNTTSEVWTLTDSDYAYIGRRGEGSPGNAYYWNGKIADVQIFATALSDDDIYNLYTSKSKSIKFSSSSTSKIILDKTKTGTVKSKITK